jgi:hypothetical protein
MPSGPMPSGLIPSGLIPSGLMSSSLMSSVQATARCRSQTSGPLIRYTPTTTANVIR